MYVKQTALPGHPFWKIFVLLLCLLVVTAARAGGQFDRGLLWKIDPGNAPASYLFGTMHSDDPAVVQLPDPVRQAFDQAASVTLEVTLDAQGLMALTTSLLLTDGTTLESMIGSSLYRRTVDVMADQGIPEMMVASMKPWAVAVTLMTPPAKSGMVLDHVLYQDAISAGKKVDGLETVAEQMGLFDSLSRDDQVRLLKDTLDQLPHIGRILAELQEAYLARNLKRLVEINEASMRDSAPDLAETFNQRLVVDRNHRMADRMESRLRDGRYFVAVGALHLPGREGLLELLTRRGYTLTRIY